MFLKTTEGSYILAAFCVKIENIGNEEIRIGDLSTADKDTFVHEYIHFLQDIILPYNLRNIEKYYYMFNLILETNDLSILNRKNDVAVAKKQFEVGFGRMPVLDGTSNIVNIKNIERETIYEEDGTGSKLFKYKMEIELDNEREITYHIGAHDMLEYIAYKITNKHYCTELPSLPYKIMDYYFDYYQNEYNISSISDDIRILLVESSLYNDLPIHHLFNMLSGSIVNEGDDNYLKQSFSDFEKLKSCLLELAWFTNKTGVDTFKTKSIRRIESFYNCFSGALQNASTDELKKWVSEIIYFGKNEIVEKDIFVFSDLYNMKTECFDKYIENLINKNIIPPIILDNKNKNISSLKNNDLNYMLLYLIPLFVDSLLNNNNNKCPIYEFCKSNDTNNYYCISCERNSKERMNLLNENECFFKYFLKLFDLYDIYK